MHIICRTLLLTLTVIQATAGAPAAPTNGRVFQFIYVPPAAGTINAASCSRDDVNTALTAAVTNSVVVIPAGTCSWTSNITWTAPAGVTVKGAGSLTTEGGGDTTNIVDDYVSSSTLLTITSNSSTLRIAGLTIKGGLGSLKPNGVVLIQGTSTLRFDHNHINTQTYAAGRNTPTVWFGDGIRGVVWGNIFDALDTDALYFFNGQGANGQANESWAAATNFGSSDFLFLEDNLFRCAASGPCRIGDSYNGSRVVWRFNTIQGASGLENHATGHAGDGRGHRASEGYGNLYQVVVGQSSPPFDMVDISSGTQLFWGNTAEFQSVKHFIHFNVTRKGNDTYTQVATPGGWGYCGTAFNGTGSNWDGNTDGSTGYPCIDQPGRGQGDLLTGSFSSKTNSTTGTIAWPNQSLEPVYVWNISGTPHAGYGGQFYANDGGGRILADRDYYAQASGIQTTSSSPFDGTTGTGWGTAARRPATCTTGVGYFATDEGSWNSSSSNPRGVDQAGADGRLYKCTSTNTWTLYYTPYSYPHPLRGGS